MLLATQTKNTEVVNLDVDRGCGKRVKPEKFACLGCQKVHNFRQICTQDYVQKYAKSQMLLATLTVEYSTEFEEVCRGLVDWFQYYQECDSV